jgi:hypothetical protein
MAAANGGAPRKRKRARAVSRAGPFVGRPYGIIAKSLFFHSYQT